MSPDGSIPNPQFANGQHVRLRARTSEMGAIVGEPRMFSRRYTYRVNVGGQVSNYPEDALEACVQTREPRELFLSGSFGDRESCLLFLTFLRISEGLSNYAYSFHNSRTRFFPHQFKPLVKFLDNPDGRILLADEVGLGKTIEAGFVLLEMEARGQLRRAIIVCPAKLRNKWMREMRDRFGFEFAVVNSTGLRQKLAEATRNPRCEFRLIASYETIRQESILDQIGEANLDLDIVVADEAHYMRNSEAQTHKAGKVLADHAAKALLLTATPINNSAEDLFNVLNILDPRVFDNFYFFEDQRRINASVVTLERLIRRGLPIDSDQAMQLLDNLKRSSLSKLYEGSFFFDKLRDSIEKEAIKTLPDLVEAQRLASRLGILSNHVVRTRRIDVEEKRPKRTPHLCLVTPSPEEDALYQAVFLLMMRHYNEFRLPVMNMERILSSCIPAFIRHYLGVCEGQESDTPWEDDDNIFADEAAETRSDIVPGLPETLDKLGSLVLKKGIDSKCDCLLETLRQLDREDPGCKVILFSYFRPTIEYLSRRLGEAGWQNVVIHGGVPTDPDNPRNDERERRREEFEHDPNIRMMIASEVGSEGLDFQFAHVVINYDLPWNPMRVEQRIGRIDRIDQKSERLLIYSLALKGTIDEYIYEKLLTKIGIFTDSLGDIESILGNEIGDIQKAVFNPKLTEPERVERLERIAEVIEHKQAEIRDLDANSAKILGTDEYIREEIRQIQSSKRYVGPDEIQRLVHHEFEGPRLGLNVEETEPGIFCARCTATARNFFERWMDRTMPANLFRGTMDRRQFGWTFSYDIAVQRRDLELLNLRHPAVRALCAYLAENSSHLPPTFRIAVPPEAAPDVDPGAYVLAVFVVKYTSLHVRKDMVPMAWRLDTSSPIEASKAGILLSGVIGGSADLGDPLEVEASTAAKAVNALEVAAEALFERKRQEIAGEEAAFMAHRREQIKAQSEREVNSQMLRRETLSRHLENYRLEGKAKEAQQTAALLKGVEVRIDNIKTRAQEKLDELGQNRPTEMSWDMRSVGLVMVG